MNFLKQKIKTAKQKGFTLIELMVVFIIFAIVGAIILFNYNSFNSNATVNTVAQEIALTVRKAQAYALGLQAPGTLATLPIRGYGVRFESSQNRQIIFFVEISPIDNEYSYLNSLNCGAPAPGEECVEYYKIETTDSIKNIIVDGVKINSDPSSSVDIIFKKPTGEVVFCVHENGRTCNSSSADVVGLIEIEVVSEDGVLKRVHIFGNGQISVK